MVLCGIIGFLSGVIVWGFALVAVKEYDIKAGYMTFKGKAYRITEVKHE